VFPIVANRVCGSVVKSFIADKDGPALKDGLILSEKVFKVLFGAILIYPIFVLDLIPL